MPPPPAVRHLLRMTPTMVQVPNRALLYISGSQATEFLNGVVSSTVPHPPRGPFFSAFLNAQGRVLRDAFVYPKKNHRNHDGYFVEYDSRPPENSLLDILKRYVLRSKVKIENVTHEYDVWSILGSEATKRWDTSRQWSWSKSGVIEPIWNPNEEWPWSDGGIEESMSLRDRRAVGMGRRVLVRKGDKPPEASSHDIVHSFQYNIHRILHGVPECPDDIPASQAFPMESNLDIMGALDFRKGCYVGQELTVRTYHTGVLRKRTLPVHIESTDGAGQIPSAGTDISIAYHEDVSEPRPRVRGTGKLLTATDGIGLALLRLEHVDLVEKGILNFRIGDSWKVNHWWPDWWPKRQDVYGPQ